MLNLQKGKREHALSIALSDKCATTKVGPREIGHLKGRRNRRQLA